MKIEELSVESIKPYEKNPRKNDGAVNGVAESIKQFGFQQPIVIDKNGVIVAGHTRYKAALQLGMKTVPCVRADQLSPKQVKAYRILDNKLNELATWNFAMLGEEIKSFDFNFDGFDVALPTLDVSDIFTAPAIEPDSAASPTATEEVSPVGNVVVSSEPQTNDNKYAEQNWVGMPQFHSEDQTPPHLVVNFRSVADKIAFSKVVNQNINEATPYIYYPAQVKEDLSQKEWE